MEKNDLIKTDETIKEMLKYEKRKSLQRPLIGAKIPAGFPSPAQDYIEGTLDLNEFLISHPAATYFVRVEGFSMMNAGIFPNDILIVDRAIEPAHNKIVVAVLEGELTLKRLKIENGRWILFAENPDYKAIEINEDSDLTIWGVATYCIHKL
jgi:DNA polymerase V